MEKPSIDQLIGQQCAPVLAGIKPSNLLIAERKDQAGREKQKNTDQAMELVMKQMMEQTGLKAYRLWRSARKEYWFLYEEKKLKELLLVPEHREYLTQCGYETAHLDRLLRLLSIRFGQYKEQKAGFPHEMGILLGYPYKDVIGFIENKGQNFKLSGYWKVYDDVDYAWNIFKLYEQVRKRVQELGSQGIGLAEICRRFRLEENTMPALHRA